MAAQYQIEDRLDSMIRSDSVLPARLGTRRKMLASKTSFGQLYVTADTGMIAGYASSVVVSVLPRSDVDLKRLEPARGASAPIQRDVKIPARAFASVVGPDFDVYPAQRESIQIVDPRRPTRWYFFVEPKRPGRLQLHASISAPGSLTTLTAGDMAVNVHQDVQRSVISWLLDNWEKLLTALGSGGLLGFLWSKIPTKKDKPDPEVATK